MPIGKKRDIIPGYKSKWTGRDIDNFIQKVAESYDCGFIILPSSEAVPYNIDKLFELGHYSIEYITESVLPSVLLEKNIKPYDVTVFSQDGIIYQSIITSDSLYIRSYEVISYTEPDCTCPLNNGRWNGWEVHSLTVPEDIVVAVNLPDPAEFNMPVKNTGAEYVIIEKKDGSEITLQEYYDTILSDLSNLNHEGNTTNINNVINSCDIKIIHRGKCYLLSDIMDKILSL